MRYQLVVLFLLFLGCLAMVSGCMKDDELWKHRPVPVAQGYDGLFIVCEGNFMYDNASVSYYDIHHNKVYNDVFYQTNALPLGDVAQSAVIRDSLAYIVVNNSGKIVVMNTRTFRYEGKIQGLVSPRYIHFLDSHKAYVSDLYARSLAVIDPITMEITGQISVKTPENYSYQHPTEQMVQYENRVYVTCWSFDNQVLVIDASADAVIDSIEVVKQPSSLACDRYGKIWVLSDGGIAGSPYGQESPGLTRIDALSAVIEDTFRFDPGDKLLELKLNGTGDTLYFIHSDVYRVAVRGDFQPEVFIQRNRRNFPSGGFYALGVDPVTSEVYVADAIDYVQRGWVYRYTAAGILRDTFQVGINPGTFCFKPKL
ncbi:MAG: YncE family protein [Bacteroidales bacterium]|nr:YncE family protein [Bacteroidales bacterium]MDD2323598.1 YncE family protein [Bacteroidales bacterium]MDD3010611.1 YncE family protein [Bacteroidales bacterium]MDD3961427.1 YncE family protein [Bacteroidales bacterium]MDY0286066.1 YncE family protein [Bacteroidales bacterium]